MKSEKAQDILSASSVTDSCGYEYLLTSSAQKAVELAEHEVEELMREKAIEAFKASCKYQDGCVAAVRECNPTQCDDLRLFIQKLNDE